MVHGQHGDTDDDMRSNAASVEHGTRRKQGLL